MDLTLERIQALLDLDYEQLQSLALQRGLVPTGTQAGREWSVDRLRLRLIDHVVDEELREQRLQTALDALGCSDV